MLLGNHVVLMPRFDPAQTLRLVEKHRVTWLLLVPTMMLRIWRLPEAVRLAADVSSLEVAFHLAAPCPAWLKQAWIDWLGPQKVVELYGGTELQAVTLISGTEWLEHRGSVGRTVLGEIEIRDPDGRPFPVGEEGEIWMRRGPEAPSPYRYVGATARSAPDGWESLGDIGKVDADGYVYITDRLADMILVGGANVYPAEIEAALDEHPAVQSCCVIGLPDEDLGNIPYAIVELSGPVIRRGSAGSPAPAARPVQAAPRDRARDRRRCATTRARSAAQRCGPSGSPGSGPFPAATAGQALPGRRGARLAELVGDQLGQPGQRVLEVLRGHHVGQGEADGGEFAGEELGVGLGPRRYLPVTLDVGPVPVVLPVLGEQDQRRGVGRLGREGQVEQDERVRIPVLDDADGVEDDPADHEHRLADQETPGAEEPRDPLGEPPERVGVVPGAHPRGAPRGTDRSARSPIRRGETVPSQPPVLRQPTGSRWSSTSSTVTAPTRRPSSSHTATLIRL